MRRKRIYHLGFFIILFLVLHYPISLLLLGEKADGVVVEQVYENSILAYISGASSSPKVDFYYNDTLYSILGEKDQKFELAERVKVVFFPWNPEGAKILSFGDLFIVPTIELPLGLLIWWALFRSFPNLFDTTISKKQYANLLMKGKLKREPPIIKSASTFIRVLIVAGVIAACGLFSFFIWTTINSMLENKLSYQLGVGISIVMLVMVLALFQKVWRG